ncbi:hypothetical protein MKD33_14765, partial [Chromobacterium piscinae]
RSNRMGYRLA